MATLAARPTASEHAPYYSRYINLVPEGDIISLLEEQLKQTLTLLGSTSEDRAGYRYAPEKWSIKEMVGHMIDAERIFSYRALRFARGDKTPLPGFEQGDYVPNAAHDKCRLAELAELAEEFGHVRRATIMMFRHLDEAAWNRRGIASENEVSVRAAAYIIAGHELHHTKILKEKYLG